MIGNMSKRARKILIIFFSLAIVLLVKLFILSLGPMYATVGGYYEPYRTMKLSRREAESLFPFKIIEVLEETDFPNYKVTALTPKVGSKIVGSKIVGRQNYPGCRFNIWWLQLLEPLPEDYIQKLLETWKSEQLHDNMSGYGYSVYNYRETDPNIKLNVIYTPKGKRIRIIEILKIYE